MPAHSPIRSIVVCLTAAALAVPGRANDVLTELDGTVANEVFGQLVRPAGDVDGDAVPDLMVGSLFGPEGGVGRIGIYSGVSGALLHTVDGESVNDGVGLSGCAAGDVDGDGFGDFVVGAWKYDQPAVDVGRLSVYSGATGDVLLQITGSQHGEQLGRSVAPAGDVDLDGTPDLVAGAWMYDEGFVDAGRAMVLSGTDLSIIHQWVGVGDNDYMGIDVRAAGDVDDDGVPDVIVGAAEYFGHGYGNGRAYVFSGSDGDELFAFEGDGFADLFGHSVTGLGDADLDGLPDLAVGAYADDDFGSKSGTARTFSGADGHAFQTFYGQFTNDRLGYAVDGLADMNGDGVPELLTCAYRTDHVGLDAGSVFVFEPTTGAQLAVLEGPEDGALFGQSMAALPDVDGDGFPDVFVAASKYDGVGVDSGKVYVLSVTPWSDLGHSLDGALGEPLLDVGGSLLPDSILHAVTSNLPPFAVANLVLGFSALEAPFKGGVLVPEADVVLRMKADGSGVDAVDLPWPAGFPSGTSIWLQTWTKDVSGPQGFSATRAVVGVTP
ncbi:MAG: FG-GAP repeat protein [Planctomycetes bacterium]|nr:FG-GAP repeat protein [Planctomycetota bacterium]